MYKRQIQAKAILTGVSARTYFMTLLLAAIGAFFGYLLAQYASDTNNVFTAAWKWAHRTRGFVRTLLDAAFIYAVVFTVIGFICLIMLSSSLHNGQMFMLFPILLPYLSFLTFALGSFGAVGITASGNIANLSLFGISNQYVGSISAPWQLWLVFVAFLITTFYIALRAAARNIYDPAYAGWQHSWKSPVATLVIWLIVTFLFTSATLGYTMQSDTYDASLNIAAWYFLVAAVWSFLIEVVALTFGPAMVLSMGGGFAKYSSLLVGDVLAVQDSDLLYLLIALVAGIALWAVMYNSLLLSGISPSLARSRGIHNRLVECAFVVLVAVAVMLAIRWVGVMLINALLILPAAAGRNLARSSRQHAVYSVVIALVCGVAGLICAYYLDTTAGAAIVLFAAVCYAISLGIRALRK